MDAYPVITVPHYILQIFPLNEKIENINDQYWTLRAEEVKFYIYNLGWISIYLLRCVVFIFVSAEILRCFLHLDHLFSLLWAWFFGWNWAERTHAFHIRVWPVSGREITLSSFGQPIPLVCYKFLGTTHVSSNLDWKEPRELRDTNKHTISCL